METYDVIIVGAGIAGTSLAYNLSEECPNKKILLIDKKQIGSSAAYGHRNTTQEVIDNYNLLYDKTYKGIKVGMDDQVSFILEKKHFFINYKKTCEHLAKKANVEFRIETALNVNSKILKTDRNIYIAKIIVDCSGYNSFAKNIFKQPKPFRYWIGKTRILKNTMKDKDYFYAHFSNSNYFEDVNPMENTTSQGDWNYTKTVDFNIKNIPEKTILKKHFPNPTILNEYNSVIPCAAVLPISYKKIVFLGDSFGSPTTSAACGIHVILDTSKMLTNAIKKNHIKSFETNWKKNYLNNYTKYLVTKLDSYHNSKILSKIKRTPSRKELLPILAKHPEIFSMMMECDPNIQIPNDMKKKYPRRAKIFQLYYYLYLKLKYTLM